MIWLQMSKSHTSGGIPRQSRKICARIHLFASYLESCGSSYACVTPESHSVFMHRSLLDKSPFDPFSVPIIIPEASCMSTNALPRVRGIYVGVLKRLALSQSFNKHLQEDEGKHSPKGDIPLKDHGQDKGLPTCCCIS